MDVLVPEKAKRLFPPLLTRFGTPAHGTTRSDMARIVGNLYGSSGLIR